jgi:phospholipid/cholesterol/gamma-HCH transport system substrate-binding protein
VTARTRVNLIAVAVASAALIMLAVTQLLVGAIGSSGYPLSLQLPDTGGIAVDQQVSVDGRIVGTITGTELTDGGVLVHLEIDRDERIPADAGLRILRRSVIGEQALDFVSDGAPRRYYEPGEVATPPSVAMPVNVQELLELADSRLASVDPEELARALSGLADAVDGRRDDLGRLVRSGGDLAAALVASSDEVERLLGSLREVAATLAVHRHTAARTLDELATSVEVLGAVRADLEGLIADGPGVLGGMTDVLDRGGADLGCLVRDLGTTAAHLNADAPRPDLEQMLALNQWFFVGIEIGAPVDVGTGIVWDRVRLLTPPPPGAPPDSYLPGKRPIPPVRPGGACTSALGSGAPAAVQDDWVPVIPDGSVE